MKFKVTGFRKQSSERVTEIVDEQDAQSAILLFDLLYGPPPPPYDAIMGDDYPVAVSIEPAS